jgi:hypothetical protein
MVPRPREEVDHGSLARGKSINTAFSAPAAVLTSVCLLLRINASFHVKQGLNDGEIASFFGLRLGHRYS